jgi:hypothetical protein
MHPFGLLLLAFCQDPSPATLPSAPRDVVEMKNGEVLVGRVTAEVDGYVEFELEAGAVLGIGRSQIADIRRGTAPAVAPGSALPPRSEAFVLHDASGEAVGWLQCAVTARDGGGAVNEEYEFRQGARRYQVTSLATLDAAGQPVSAYFRERITEPVLASVRMGFFDSGQNERVVDERIVEAVRVGDRLVVRRLDGNGRAERELAWPQDATFPLLAREHARAAGKAMPAALLFDPASDELVVRSYDGARRRAVVIDGVSVQVTEFAETGVNGRNAEWVDASARTLRRELSGPALVAVPTSAANARAAIGRAAIAPAIAADAGGTFGLWVPNPAWVVQEGTPPGQLVLACAPHTASASLTRLDHLAAGTPLDVAADAVANWFGLLQPELAIRSRAPDAIRDRPCVQLTAAGRRGGVATRACIDVLAHGDQFLVLVCTAPEQAWDELGADFAFLRRTIELEAQSLAPRLQGPLAMPLPRVAPGGQAARGAAVSAPANAPAKEPIVRIPRDG